MCRGNNYVRDELINLIIILFLIWKIVFLFAKKQWL